MKKFVFASLFFALFSTFSCQLNSVSDSPAVNNGQATAIGTMANSTGDTVKLVTANSYVHTYNGMSQIQRNFTIRVKNLAYTKNVAIWQKQTNGTWAAIAASYSGAADNGYEIWSAYTSEMYSSVYADQFCVRYIVNGTTCWDNNNGANFSMVNGDGVLLGRDVNINLNSAWISASSFVFYGNIDLKNLGYTKTVQVCYTTDNWATTRTINASFVSGYAYGYATAKSPNLAGTERWTFTGAVSTTTNIRFYLKYTVNGSTYYDNNYGKNYVPSI